MDGALPAINIFKAADLLSTIKCDLSSITVPKEEYCQFRAKERLCNACGIGKLNVV